MLDTDDLDLSTLLKLYNHLGALICEEMGHDWYEVPITHEGHGVTTTGPTVERCRRCKATRQGRSSLSSNTSTTVELSGGR